MMIFVTGDTPAVSSGLGRNTFPNDKQWDAMIA
jgi:hypothetical protein